MIPELSAADPNDANEAEKLFSDNMLKAVFDNVQDGVLLFDKKGYLLDINRKGLKIHGLDTDEKKDLINNPFNFFHIYNDKHQELSAEEGPLMRLLNGEAFSNISYIVKVSEEKPEIRISYSGIPLFSKEGAVTSAILMAYNSSDSDIKTELVKDVFAREEKLKELELYQQQLKEDRELLHTIIDTIPVMVTIYDKRINSFIMNRAFENITGWRDEDIKTSGIMELAYPDPDYRQEILSFMQSLSPGFKDIVIRTRDGRDVETSWANVELPDGRKVGVGIDISERKDLENELIKARERAEWENQVQYGFIQNISHEVRTPMNSILGFTELLQKEIKQEKEAEYLNAIAFNGKQLLRLINDIIDFSRLDNNQVLLNKEQVFISEFMQQVELQLAGMKKAYNKRHLDVKIKQPENNVQVILNSDSFRLQQVIINLIGNAIKYTNEGYVEIGYTLREAKQDVLFYVKDTGIGIRENDKNKVFKRFNRLHDTRSFEFRGTGLGLAICKHLVKLLGGEIWFNSEIDKGTTFYFSHPYFALEKIMASNTLPSSEDECRDDDANIPDLKNRVILVVEDDSFSYMMMYHMLEETKALVLHADSGTKAVEIFNKYAIDLVFLDIRIPEMDGYEVIRHMHKTNNSVPVIAQTANALPEDKKKLADAGFDFHLTKPISRHMLYNVLNRFLPVEKII
ncbi:MAG: ATP-binding protein [Bacteroidota bacterium]